MEIISNTIQTTLDSFDFAFCIIVNVLTYLIITVVNELKSPKVLTKWNKRLVLIAVILLTGVVYYFIKSDVRTVINSAMTCYSGLGQFTYPITLFAFNILGTISCSSCRIGLWIAYKGCTKVAEMIPVRVGQVGYMYDKVSGNLFGNSGTGSFTLGPDVT